jgi:hypothetical protein
VQEEKRAGKRNIGLLGLINANGAIHRTLPAICITQYALRTKNAVSRRFIPEFA